MVKRSYFLRVVAALGLLCVLVAVGIPTKVLALGEVPLEEQNAEENPAQEGSSRERRPTGAEVPANEDDMGTDELPGDGATAEGELTMAPQASTLSLNDLARRDRFTIGFVIGSSAPNFYGYLPQDFERFFGLYGDLRVLLEKGGVDLSQATHNSFITNCDYKRGYGYIQMGYYASPQLYPGFPMNANAGNQPFYLSGNLGDGCSYRVEGSYNSGLTLYIDGVGPASSSADWRSALQTKYVKATSADGDGGAEQNSYEQVFRYWVTYEAKTLGTWIQKIVVADDVTALPNDIKRLVGESCEYEGPRGLYGKDEQGTSGGGETSKDEMRWEVTGPQNNRTLRIYGKGEASWSFWWGGDDAPWASYASSVRSIVVEDGITRIMPKSFKNFSSVASVSLPRSLKEIDYEAFDGCSSLASIVVPEGVTDFTPRAFNNCNALSRVTLPAELFNIYPEEILRGYEGTIYELPSVKEVVVSGKQMPEINMRHHKGRLVGESGQSWWPNVQKVTFLNSVRNVGGRAFVRAPNLREVVLGSGVESVDDGAFSECPKLSRVQLNGSLKQIGNDAFKSCGSLKNIDLPGGLQRIGSWAFSGSSLSQVTLNAALTSIGDSAFRTSTIQKIILPRSIQITSMGEWVVDKGVHLYFDCTKDEFMNGTFYAWWGGTSFFEHNYLLGGTYSTYHFNAASITRANVGTLDWAGSKFSVEPYGKTTYYYESVDPKPVVEIGKYTLKEGEDYELSYKKELGTRRATITIRGKGYFTDSISVSYKLKYDASFPDVSSNAWYGDVVGGAVAAGLFNGYKDGRFGPNDKVTRGQVAVILWNMAGKPGPKGTAKSFPDVAAGKYYYDAVRWASSVGVVNGYKDGKFGPEDPVTREQLTAMLANYAGKVAGRGTSGSAADFRSMKDAGKVSSWARSAVGWCFKNKIISGTKDGRVNPQGNATRAETAKMVVFLHDML